MRVVLRHPRREIKVAGPVAVDRLLGELDLVPESVLVIRNDAAQERAGLRLCAHCGAPTTGETCASCRPAATARR